MNDDGSLARSRGIDKNQNSSFSIRLRSRAILFAACLQRERFRGKWLHVLGVAGERATSQCLIARVWCIAKRMPPLDYERVARVDIAEIANFSDFARVHNTLTRIHARPHTRVVRYRWLQQRPGRSTPRSSPSRVGMLPLPSSPSIRGGAI